MSCVGFLSGFPKMFDIEGKPSPRSPEWRGLAGFATRELELPPIKELLPAKPYFWYSSTAFDKNLS